MKYAVGNGGRMSPSARRLLLPLLVMVLATPAFAQRVRFGAKGGVPIKEYFETGRSLFRRGQTVYTSATRRYTVGASAEFRFSRSVGVEVDVLYKRIGYVRSESGRIVPVTVIQEYEVKGHSWEFPIMAKYRFGQRIAPFVAGGLALRHIGPVRALGLETVDDLISRTITITPIDTSDPSELKERDYLGITFGVGVEFGPSRFRLLPEFRYTGWISNIGDSRDPLRLRPNQTEFLLGFLF